MLLRNKIVLIPRYKIKQTIFLNKKIDPFVLKTIPIPYVKLSKYLCDNEKLFKLR